jgi:hypothetical protein
VTPYLSEHYDGYGAAEMRSPKPQPGRKSGLHPAGRTGTHGTSYFPLWKGFWSSGLCIRAYRPRIEILPILLFFIIRLIFWIARCSICRTRSRLMPTTLPVSESDRRAPSSSPNLKPH